MPRFFRTTPGLECTARGHYRVRFYDPATKRKKYVACRTRDAAIADRRFRRLVREYEEGRFDPFAGDAFEFERVRVDEAVDRFERHMTRRVAEGASVETRRDYVDTARMLARRLPPGLSLAALTSAAVRAFIYRDDLSPATQSAYYRKTAVFLRWCVDARLAPANPIDDVPRPVDERTAPAFLRRHEFDRLVRAVEGDHYAKRAAGVISDDTDLLWLADAFRVLVATGMRRAELCALRWIDVDLRHRMIYVRAYRRADGRRHRTKRRKDRTVPVFPAAAAVLDRLAAARADERPDAYVFPNQTGGALYGPYLSRKFRQYRRLAGLPETYHLHTLRHTFASWLRLEGVGVDRIMEWLGHSTIEQTLVYAHLVPEDVAVEGAGAFPAPPRSEIGTGESPVHTSSSN